MEWKTHIARENDETSSNDERTIWLNDEWLWNDKDTIELQEMTKCKDTIEFEEMIKCRRTTQKQCRWKDVKWQNVVEWRDVVEWQNDTMAEIRQARNSVYDPE